VCSVVDFDDWVFDDSQVAGFIDEFRLPLACVCEGLIYSVRVSF